MGRRQELWGMVMRRLVTNFKAGTNDNDGGEPGDDQEGDDDIVQNNVEKNLHRA